jgi:hypothetical protein
MIPMEQNSTWAEIEEIQMKAETVSGLLDGLYYAVISGNSFTHRGIAVCHILEMSTAIAEELAELKEKLIREGRNGGETHAN